MAATANKFRSSFKISKDKITWYPGHMRDSFKHMQAVMRKIDCIVEVHDSRIPFSGRNPAFINSLVGTKPHILVLNKSDLIDPRYFSAIQDKCLEENCENLIFTSCLDRKTKGLKEIIPMAVELCRGESYFLKLNSDLKMMVVGVPNVGKSSLINSLRNIVISKGKATQVGPTAGVTKAVMNEIKVHTNPPMYLIDTPGILLPNIQDIESGMKLALCSCLKDNLVGPNIIADFLLYWMNKTENFIYVDYFHLKQPTDEIFPLLVKIAFDKNLKKKVKNLERNTKEIIPDVDAAANYMVSLYRNGRFGDLCLDRNYL